MQVIRVIVDRIGPGFGVLKGDGIAGLEGHAIHTSDRLPGTIGAIVCGGEAIAGVACSYSGTNTARATHRIRTWVRRLVCMRHFSPCVKQICFQRLLYKKYTFIRSNKQVEKEELLSCGMQELHRRAEHVKMAVRRQLYSLYSRN